MFKPKSISIPEFYKGKSVFLTGATGFVGVLVVEKLLRSCPDVKNIYVLIRKKKSNTIEERLAKWKEGAAFEVLREVNPTALDKVIPIAGDMTEEGLGISDIDRTILIKNVSIVFHVGASVRFDDFLQTAILTNVRSTRDVLELVSQLDTVDVFVYVGTAYSNCDKKFIEEKGYPQKWDWREAIRLAENPDAKVKELTDHLIHKFIEPMPNTYVFTKGLAENVIQDLCLDRFPVCIIRPSIVLATMQEPFPGYVGNMYGPTGIIFACGTGLVKAIHAALDLPMDHAYADNIAKAAIIASWQQKIRRTTNAIRFYNITSDLMMTVLGQDKYGKQVMRDNPLKFYIGAANTEPMSCAYKYYIYNLLFHFFPALVFDLILKIMGQNLSILKFRRKIAVSNEAYLPFSKPQDKKPWKFENKNYVQLESTLLDSDKTAFSYLHTRAEGVNDDELMKKTFSAGMSKGRTLLFPHEREHASEAEVLRYKRVELIDKIVKKAFWAFLIYIAVWKYSVLTVLSNKFVNYLENL